MISHILLLNLRLFFHLFICIMPYGNFIFHLFPLCWYLPWLNIALQIIKAYGKPQNCAQS